MTTSVTDSANPFQQTPVRTVNSRPVRRCDTVGKVATVASVVFYCAGTSLAITGALLDAGSFLYPFAGAFVG